MDHETTRGELYDQIERLKSANARRVQDLHELVDPTIDLLRRVSGHLEPYVCFESLRKDVIDDINRLQGILLLTTT